MACHIELILGAEEEGLNSLDPVFAFSHTLLNKSCMAAGG
jgi:hypothetical protein